MKNLKDKIKSKVKAKTEAVKENLKSKLKGAKKLAEATALGLIASLYGCMDTNPASRLNANTFGDIEPAVKVVIGENACSNVVNVTMPVTLGDGVLASADSSGSTETQTATPTQEIKPDTNIEVPVNKSGGGAQSVGSTLGDAAAGLVKGLVEDKPAETAAATTAK